MLQDYKLGVRMLVKYPGLTIAGGLALAIAIGIGAGWYDLWGKLLAPAIPLPQGDRLVLIETRNTLTNQVESRVVHDFLDWRRELKTIQDLGAYRTDIRSLVVSDASPEPIRIAELTAAAFRASRVPPLFGRALLASDEVPGAPGVVVLGYDVWQRSLGGRRDVIGTVVTLGNIPATVIGVMPERFHYPVNHHAWAPLQLRASYGALEGGPIRVIGRLTPGVTRDQANTELRVIGERAASALSATHEHLRSRVTGLGDADVLSDVVQLAIANGPGLLVLLVACLTVGTLVYARTATREGEIALRSALGASRGRIVAQLFVEALVLASVAAAVGLLAADRILRWGIEGAFSRKGGAPFWMTTGLEPTTILYASLLAIVAAALLSLLPALRITRARVHTHLANLSGGATLRFGRVWTTAMIAQVALTAVGIPVAIENASQAMRTLRIRAHFPSREYVAARVDTDRPFDGESTSSFEARRAQTVAALEQRILQEPGVVAVAFADFVPGALVLGRAAAFESLPGSSYTLRAPTVWPGFFEAFNRPIVAGRNFNGNDRRPAARTVIVNEAFARRFRSVLGTASPIGTLLHYVTPPARSDSTVEAAPPSGDDTRDTGSFEIVGVVRDLGLDPDDEGDERPFVFHAAASTATPLAMSVHVRGNPATLVARLPRVATEVDSRLYVQDARSLAEWIWERDLDLIQPVGSQVGVTALVLFLSAMGIYSLMSVSVSRRTREIGLRAALGANPRQVLAGVVFRAMVLLGSGVTVGGALLLWGAALAGPTGRPADDVTQFVVWLALTSAVMLVASLLACLGPARRALRINPIDALRET